MNVKHAATNNSSVVSNEFVASGTCLPSHCLPTVGEVIHTGTEQGDLIRIIKCFQNMGNRLKNFGLSYANAKIKRPLTSKCTNVFNSDAYQ
jgi:hypothetical protein